MVFRDKYLNILKDIILSNIDNDKHIVFLFGSRVNNNKNINADVDVGITGEKLSNSVYVKIMNEIEESVVPYHVDIVDFNLVDEAFKKVALKKIEIWNQPKDLELEKVISRSD